MTVIRRRPIGHAANPLNPGPEHLGIVCAHCNRPLGEVRLNGKVQLPQWTFARQDGGMECRCKACRRDTPIPYAFATVPCG